MLTIKDSLVIKSCISFSPITDKLQLRKRLIRLNRRYSLYWLPQPLFMAGDCGTQGQLFVCVVFLFCFLTHY